jgi:hypothetical protein
MLSNVPPKKSNAIHDFLSNRPRSKLLACMTAADLSALEPYLEPVALGLRQRWSCQSAH